MTAALRDVIAQAIDSSIEDQCSNDGAYDTDAVAEAVILALRCRGDVIVRREDLEAVESGNDTQQEYLDAWDRIDAAMGDEHGRNKL